MSIRSPADTRKIGTIRRNIEACKGVCTVQQDIVTRDPGYHLTTIERHEILEPQGNASSGFYFTAPDSS